VVSGGEGVLGQYEGDKSEARCILDIEASMCDVDCVGGPMRRRHGHGLLAGEKACPSASVEMGFVIDREQ
jgi:hypothetical protein